MLKLLFILSVIPHTALAQNASVDSSAKKVCFTDPLPFIIKTSPVAPFYKNKMVTLGIEAPLCKNFSAGLEAGYIFGTSEKLEKINTRHLNYDLRLDAKYYFARGTNLRLYTGPLLNYSAINTDKAAVKWYKGTDDNGNEVDLMQIDTENSTAIKRETVNILWQAGIQPVLCSHISFNLFTALGVGMDFDRTKTKEGETKRNENTYLGSLTGVHVGFAF